MTAFGAVLNIGFNLRLIPVAGAVGAAFATLATNMFMAASLFWLGRKVFPVNFFAVMLLAVLPVLSGPLAGLPQAARLWILTSVTVVSFVLVNLLRPRGPVLPVDSGGEE
jgi:O-antigen/teichoic acid export membrane protein